MFTLVLGLLILLAAVVAIGLLVRWIRDVVAHRKEARKRRQSVRPSQEQRVAAARARREMRELYLDSLDLGWYQVVLIFVIGSFGGLVLEETWMFITANLTQSRVGLVWGPFSPLYGFGTVLLTGTMFRLRKRTPSLLVVFLSAVLIGGLLEQVTGWGMEHIFHVESWTYEYLPDRITKYIAWRFLLFWGLLGIVWYKFIMPNLLYMIGTPTTRRATVFVGLLAIYVSIDIFMTLAVFDRMVQRSEGVPAIGTFDLYLDNNYPDEWIRARFQNLVVETGPREQEAA